MFRSMIAFGAVLVVSVAAQDTGPGQPVERIAASTRPSVTTSPDMASLPKGIRRMVPSVGGGIARDYPGDFGIRENKLVLFTEDFDSDQGLKSWTDRKGQASINADGHGGTKCAQILATLADPKAQGGHLFKRLPFGEDEVFCRFYVRFKSPHDYVGHLVSLTGDSPAEPVPFRGDGICPDGNVRFMTSVEPFGYAGAFPQPGAWRLLSYWCEMEMDRVDNKYWGNGCGTKVPVVATQDTWTCVEMMVKMNTTPSERDGVQAFWIDGKLASGFEGFRWRTARNLQVNGVWLNYFMSSVSAARQGATQPLTTSTVQFDDVVVAKAYVGPKVKGVRKPIEKEPQEEPSPPTPSR